MDKKAIIFKYTGQSIFHTIFNESSIVLKNNIKLVPLNFGNRVISHLLNNVIQTDMPEPSVPYYVYICSKLHISNLVEFADEWMDLATVLNDYNVNFDLITNDNVMIPKKLVMCKQIGDKTIIVIRTNVFSKLACTNISPYLIVNTDTDTVDDKSVSYHIPGVVDNFSAVYNKIISSDENAMSIYIDGYNYTKGAINGIPNLDTKMIEVYIDEHIVFTYTKDLNDRDTYLSTAENLYKDLILIPSDLSLGRVYSYDTISVVVRGYDGRGVIVPFVAEHSVSQLTHNSFSVSSYLIDAAYDLLGITQGELLIQVCDYSKLNPVIDNGIFEKKLYMNDDDFILDALTDELVPDVPKWTANEIEQSAYSKYLVDSLPIEYNEVNMTKYIEILGYHNFIDLVCSHNGSIDIVPMSNITNISVNVPVYWEDTELDIQLYLGGKKILRSTYTLERSGSTINVLFDNLLHAGIHSELHYTLLLAEVLCSDIFIPEADDRLWVIPKGVSLYMVDDSVVYPGASGDIGPGYDILDIVNGIFFSVTEDDDTYSLLFTSGAYGRHFITSCTGTTGTTEYLDIDISTGTTISIILTTMAISDNNVLIPILSDSTYEVYLNGKYLVEGIDYNKQILNSNGTLFGYQIVIQNLKYLDDTNGNNVEIVRTNKYMDQVSIGYVVDETIPISIGNDIWKPGISSCYINGNRISPSAIVELTDRYEIASSACNNGDIFCMNVSISNDIKNDYTFNELPTYTEHKDSITEHFSYVPDVPDILVIPYVNKIYSTYLNKIILDILDDTLVVAYVNNDDAIMSQVDSYEYLKVYDTIFTDSRIDLRYVDLYPTYLANLTTDDHNKHLFINRLIHIVLGNDVVNDGMIVYTQF